MLTLPDLKEKQILFIQAERDVKNKIKFENDNVVFMKDDVVISRASCHKVFAIFVVGDMTITTGILREAARFGVSMFFMKNNFNTYSAVNSFAQGNYLLRSAQYNIKKSKENYISKMLVMNKISNQASLIHEKKGDEKVIKKLNYFEKSVADLRNDNSILGVEGNASKIFFKEYFKNIGWYKRAPRARQDTTNFLMDIGYTIMFNFIDALLNLYGFDTYKGVYHKLFFQRKSLSCDIVEPFRSIIDRQILKSFNLKQINEKDFKFENGQYELHYVNSQKYAAIFMEAIMERKEDIYLFTQGFYRYFMDDKKYQFPVFVI